MACEHFTVTLNKDDWISIQSMAEVVRVALGSAEEDAKEWACSEAKRLHEFVLDLDSANPVRGGER